MHWYSLIDEYLPALVALRRQLHRYPELAFQEKCTAALVTSTLVTLGISTRTGIAGTGVIGLIPGRGGRTVAIRADMDALPIQEQNNVTYASTVDGVSHACGHDGHVAIALGAAMVLSKLAPLPGQVKFIFQPAEEGPGGARLMIEQGVLHDPEVEAVFGFHLNNTLNVGQIGITYGQTCAATDDIKITVCGKGGHGAVPNQAVDAVTTAAQIITGLQMITSRQISPLDAVVLTIGTINGGCTGNIIADKVELTGTVRTLSERVRASLPEKIERLVSGVTAAHGSTYRFTYTQGYPSLFTDHFLSGQVAKSAAQVVGVENIIRLQPTMGGEDFAYFAQEVPASFIRIGSGNAQFCRPGHHPEFDFAEEAMAIGVKVLVQSVFDYFGD